MAIITVQRYCAASNTKIIIKGQSNLAKAASNALLTLYTQDSVAVAVFEKM